MARIYDACRQIVFNRGRPPAAFLNELVDWALTAPDEIFEVSPNPDIYSVMANALWPWRDLAHRKAGMLETLRVLAGYESSWNWQDGRDITNPKSGTPCTEEAGIFQCSGDSMNYDPVLRELLRREAGATDCDTFRRVSKDNHAFAIEYCARLLRINTQHHGPIKHGYVANWVRRDAVEEFARILETER